MFQRPSNRRAAVTLRAHEVDQPTNEHRLSPHSIPLQRPKALDDIERAGAHAPTSFRICTRTRQHGHARCGVLPTPRGGSNPAAALASDASTTTTRPAHPPRPPPGPPANEGTDTRPDARRIHQSVHGHGRQHGLNDRPAQAMAKRRALTPGVGGLLAVLSHGRAGHSILGGRVHVGHERQHKRLENFGRRL